MSSVEWARARGRSVYLDHNATTPLAESARGAISAYLDAPGGNPSSVHTFGRVAKAALEAARRQVALALDVRATEIVLTSGATEALHLAVGGMVGAGAHVVTTAVEHPAMYGALEVARAVSVRVAPSAAGRVSPDEIARAVLPTTQLVAVIGAQNEVGTLQPLSEIVRAVGEVPVLCDATQMWGKVALRPRELGLAAVALSGHKVGAPAGIGILWLASGRCISPLQRGGAHERGRRAGTENLIGAGLRQLEPSLVVHGDLDYALPNTLAFRVPDLPADAVLAGLDLEGICVSAGSACASGAVEVSPVLRALGLSDSDARRGLRISLGPENCDAEVDAVLRAWPDVARRIREAET
jgi:cysteine desulfurase